MKKILSLVLALTLVLSTMSMAFADTAFPDIDADDDQLAEAAGLLNSLGVLAGDENGNYNPEDPLTREAMAKVVVHLLGYTEDDYKGYGNEFTDAQNMWSTDVIGLAADEGIVKGYGNGIFAPKENVTYLQAAIMLIRALGYTDASLNNGVDAFDAGKYRAKALQLGLFDGVATAWNEPATRGDLAIMSYNNLENDLVVVDAEGKAEVVTEVIPGNPATIVNKTLLSETATVKVMDIDKDDVANASTDISMYIYQNVEAYYVELEDEDGEEYDSIIYVNKSNSKTVTDKVETATGTTEITTKDSNDKVIEYDVDATTKVFYNGAETTLDKISIVGKTATIVYKEAADSNDPHIVTGIIVNVLDSNGTKKVADEYETDDTTFAGITLPKDSDNEVDLTKVTVTGDASDMYEIEENDIVEAYSAIDRSVVKLVVTRNAVEGKITRENSDGEFYIDTLGEYVTEVAGMGLSLEVGTEGTFLLNAAGNIAGYIGESAAVADYMMVTKVVNGVSNGTATLIEGKVTFLDNDGETVTYEVADGATLNKDTTNLAYTHTVGSAVAVLNLAEENIISNITLKDDQITNIDVVDSTTLKTPSYTTDSKTFDAYVADDVVIFEADGTTYATRTLEQLVAAKLENDGVTDEYKVLFNNDGKIVLVIAEKALVSTSSDYAIITSVETRANDDGDSVDYIFANVAGVDEEYYGTTTNAVDNDTEILKGLYTLTMDGNDVVDVVAADYLPTLSTSTTLSAINSSVLLDVANNENYVLTDDAVVYLVNKDGSYGGIVDLEYIDDLSANKTDAEVVCYVADNAATDAKEKVVGIIVTLK